MKKLLTAILLFSLLWANPYCLKAQLLHVKGVKGVLSEGSIEKNGFGIGAGYYKIFSRNFFYKALAEYHSSNQTNTGTKIVNGFFEVGYTAFSIKQQFYINFIGGAGFGAEMLKDKVYSKNKVSPIGIESLGLMLEYCPSPRITTALYFRQRFLQLNNNGNALYQIGLSFQYNLN